MARWKWTDLCCERVFRRQTVEQPSKIFFSPSRLVSLWSEWELRGLVLFSLLLQIVLVSIGSRRKKVTSEILKAVIWCAYVLADLVATYSLGIISRTPQVEATPDCLDQHYHYYFASRLQVAGVPPHPPSPLEAKAKDEYDANMQLVACWAPFLLLHLGGPDAITALSLEDNQLWLRRALELVTQVVLVIYVFIRHYLMAWVTSYIWLPYGMVFLAGLLKYAERTYALWRGSLDALRRSVLGEPGRDPLRATSQPAAFHPVAAEDQVNPDARAVSTAMSFFGIFKGLFVDNILSYRVLQESHEYFRRIEHDEAFRVVGMELRLAYDALFTKASVSNSVWGFLVRTLSLLLTSISLVLFSSLVDKSEFRDVDVVVTQILLVGAVVLDMVSLVCLLFSPWTIVFLRWFGRDGGGEWLRKQVWKWCLTESPPWSDRLSQYNLIASSVHPAPSKVQWLLNATGVKDWWENHHYTEHIAVEDCLKKFIFEDLKFKSVEVSKTIQEHARHMSDVPQILQQLECIRKVEGRLTASRGQWALEREGLLGKLDKYVLGAEFDESILLWHLATDICYRRVTMEAGPQSVPEDLRMARQLSNYMLYLLVVLPHMLSSATLSAQKRYRETRDEIKKEAREIKIHPIPTTGVGENISQRVLLENKSILGILRQRKSNRQGHDDGIQLYVDKNSVLPSGLDLAIELEEGFGGRWKIVLQVWVEMLCYAAVNCRGYHHAQRLSQGGELLTFTWFLMTHLQVGAQTGLRFEYDTERG